MTLKTIDKTAAVDLVRSKFRTIPDFPKKGIVFFDITTVIKDKDAFKASLDFFEEHYKNKKIDYIAGLEARGFIFGSALADRLGCGFILIRKPGKLPYKTISESYELEYGTDNLEIHADAIEAGKNVVIVDDLLATGGTANAAYNLIKKCGANVESIAFVLELSNLEGRKKLPKGVEVISMISEEE